MSATTKIQWTDATVTHAEPIEMSDLRSRVEQLIAELERELSIFGKSAQKAWTYENRNTSAHALLRDSLSTFRAVFSLLSVHEQEEPPLPKDESVIAAFNEGFSWYPQNVTLAEAWEQSLTKKRLLGAEQEETREEWRPIESAPMDCPILVHSTSLGPVIVKWSDQQILPELGRTQWCSYWDGDALAREPTHWMPLPPAPVEQDKPLATASE